MTSDTTMDRTCEYREVLRMIFTMKHLVNNQKKVRENIRIHNKESRLRENNTSRSESKMNPEKAAGRMFDKSE